MGTSHRQKPVKELVGRVRDGLARAVRRCPTATTVALGNGGATAFWDAATFGLVRERAHHLVFGEFSAQVREGDAGRAVPRATRSSCGPSPATRPAPVGRPGRRRPRLGAQRDLDRRDGPGRRARPGSGDALVLIDATSGAGGLPLDAAQADVYYFAPQKCFAADGGLWLALLSPAAQERIARDRGVRPLDPGLPEPRDGARQQPQGPDVQHAGDRARSSCSPSSSTG